ncbi:hypothetical protein GGS24DRAFT_472193 [Hypoxylon argillaceum]|nr:hypothetical protein GGS24DRAFT_472193 [Hypoxylon argillaceum]
MLRLLSWIWSIFLLVLAKTKKSIQAFCDSFIRRQSTISTLHEQCASQNQQLAQLWQLSQKSSILFIAIHLQFDRRDSKKINAIGLCKWYPGFYAMECFHWQIAGLGMAEDLNAQSKIERFSFGETDFITESHIKSTLDEAFRLPSHIKHASLVGHDLDAQLGHLKVYWEPPDCVTTIDTQKIWQFQCQDDRKVLLANAVRGIPHDYLSQCDVNHAGNAARCIIGLLNLYGPDSIVLGAKFAKAQG